jgi:hypothetical protein
MTKSGVQQHQHHLVLSVIAGDRLRSWSFDCADETRRPQRAESSRSKNGAARGQHHRVRQ